MGLIGTVGISIVHRQRIVGPTVPTLTSGIIATLKRESRAAVNFAGDRSTYFQATDISGGMSMHWIIRGAVLLPIVAAPFSAQAESWVTDPITGCQMWSDAPEGTKETATWTGDCAGGKASGDGVLVWIENGALLGRYVGAMKDGKLHGDGVLVIWSDSGKGFDTITGAFVNGAPEGSVVAVTAAGERYEGAVANGDPHGEGVYEDTAGNSYEGVFKNGLPDGVGYSKTADGEEYFGDFRNGERHGHGILLADDGDSYLGAFANGKAEGFGLVEAIDGSVYEGAFKSGLPDGAGLYRAADGSLYQGRFKGGELDGMVLRTQDGKQTVETWKNGEKVK